MRIILIFGRKLSKERLRIRMTLSFACQRIARSPILLSTTPKALCLYVCAACMLTSAYEFRARSRSPAEIAGQNSCSLSHRNGRSDFVFDCNSAKSPELAMIHARRWAHAIYAHFHARASRRRLSMASCFALRNEMILQIVETWREF